MGNRTEDRGAGDGAVRSGTDTVAYVVLFHAHGADPDEQIGSQLEQHGYRVKPVSRPEDLQQAGGAAVNALVVLVETPFTEESDTVLRVFLEGLRKLYQPLPRIIVLSDRDDVTARVAAHRMGATGYFVKPVKTAALVQAFGHPGARERMEPGRVMVVSEEDTTGRSVCDALEACALVPRLVGDPAQLLTELADFRPDLVLLDVAGPDYTGFDLAAVIRQNDEWAHKRVIVLSESNDPDQQLAALQAGCDMVLAKPLGPAEVVRAVQTHLVRARTARRLANLCRNTREEHEALLTALDQHDIVSIADVAGTIVYANARFCEVSGYSREELVGSNHNLLNSGYHEREYFQNLWTTIAKGEIWHGEICNRRKDGSLYWVLCTIVPFPGIDGRPYKYVSLRTDITKLRVSEERLQRSQFFANIGTWDWNIHTGALYWSERIGVLFGYGEAVPETSYENFLAAIHPDDRQQVIDAVDACVQRGVDYNIEHRVMWPDGGVRWLHERGDVVCDIDGRPLRMLGVVQDITERKTAEARLARAKEEAEKANQAKSQFLSSMSHELRTPMNAILGFAQLLEANALTQDQRESVEEISRAGHHLMELINGVLDLAKIEAGRVDLCTQPIELAELFEDCCPLIGPLLQKHRVTLQCPVEQWRGLSVKADATRLKQVVLNVLSNACKYNRPGGAVTVACGLSENDKVVISVRDTGRGIPPERRIELFQPFSRLGAENSDIEGSGIGLVITRQLVELMGGRLELESRVGEGSEFWIELPLAGAVDGAVPPRLARGAPRQLETDVEVTILYVEDNPANVRLVSRLLERRPRTVLVTADQAAAGLELARRQRPDLILLDINLAGTDGYQLLEELRAEEAGRDIPILAISANAMLADVERGLRAGFNAYLTKPLDVQAFFREIDAHLAVSRARRAAGCRAS